MKLDVGRYREKYIYCGVILVGDGKYLVAKQLKEMGYTINRSLYTYSPSPPYIPDLSHDNFDTRLIKAFKYGFEERMCEYEAFRVAKSIAKRLRKRNKYGVGLVGPVIDFKPGDEESIAFSTKGIGRKNVKRRTKLKMSRFIKRHVLQNLPDSLVEKINNAYSGITFSVMCGEDAANLYEGKGKFNSSVTSNQSCMQGTTYNTHLFEENEDKYMLLVVAKLGKILGRTKLYKNDDGTYFLGTRTYSEENLRSDFERHFEANYKEGPLCCTLNHEVGEEMPYIDETVDGYGMDRLDSSTIKLHKNGEHACDSCSGEDPSEPTQYCCKCSEPYEHDIDGEFYCDYCANERFAIIDGEWVSLEDCVYSDWHSEHIHEDNAVSFIRNRYGDTDYTYSCDDLFEYNGEWYHDSHAVEVDGESVPKWLCIQVDGEWRLSE